VTLEGPRDDELRGVSAMTSVDSPASMQPNGQLFLGLHAHAANAGERFSETRTGLDHVSFALA